MAGKMCPKCSNQTLWNEGSKLRCSKCNYTVLIPVNDGKGGKGTKCPACGKFTWFNGCCNNCGARER